MGGVRQLQPGLPGTPKASNVGPALGMPMVRQQPSKNPHVDMGGVQQLQADAAPPHSGHVRVRRRKKGNGSASLTTVTDAGTAFESTTDHICARRVKSDPAAQTCTV